MKARMGNPAMIVPNALQSLLAVGKAVTEGGELPNRTRHLVHLRASQINGCSYCVNMHAADAIKDGDTPSRIFAVSAWRHTGYFTDEERAALAEAVTRLSDREDPVPDEVWDEAADYFNERQLAGLLLEIAMVNTWNRLMVSTQIEAPVLD